LLYQQLNVSNNTEITYNWTSPVTIPDSDTILLFHLDNNSDYGENQTHVFDFALSHNNGTANGDAFPNLTGGKLAGGWEFDGDGEFTP